MRGRYAAVGGTAANTTGHCVGGIRQVAGVPYAAERQAGNSEQADNDGLLHGGSTSVVVGLLLFPV
jgi:hypothetical protein